MYPKIMLGKFFKTELCPLTFSKIILNWYAQTDFQLTVFLSQLFLIDLFQVMIGW